MEETPPSKPSGESPRLEGSNGAGREERNATQAMQAIREAGNRGHNVVLDAGIKGFFDGIDDYVHPRLNHWQHRRGGERSRFRFDAWPHARSYGLGLHRLRTTVAFPSQATPVRPSLSRVREMRTHGLKGGAGNGAA